VIFGPLQVKGTGGVVKVEIKEDNMKIALKVDRK